MNSIETTFRYGSFKVVCQNEGKTCITNESWAVSNIVMSSGDIDLYNVV